MNLIVITIGLVPFQMNSVVCIKFQSRLDRNSCAVPRCSDPAAVDKQWSTYSQWYHRSKKGKWYHLEAHVWVWRTVALYRQNGTTLTLELLVIFLLVLVFANPKCPKPRCLQIFQYSRFIFNLLYLDYDCYTDCWILMLWLRKWLTLDVPRELSSLERPFSI